jgi:uncharacterized protein (TIGR00266 family)
MLVQRSTQKSKVTIMPEISCSNCNSRYRIEDQHFGKTIRCTNCGTTFTATPPVSLAANRPVPSADSSYTAQPYHQSPNPSPTNSSTANSQPRVYVAPPGKRGTADEIDYAIYGDDTQYVEVGLDPGETVIAEAGSMMYMTSGIEMQTVFGDPSQAAGGFWNKVVAAGKRVLTGESLFMTTFTNSQGRGKETVAFAAPYMGRITPLHLDQLGGEMICQKDSFLCGAKGVQVSIALQKKIGVGLFGGEGFILQRLKGDGIALVHAGGALMQRELAPGERLKLDTGCLMAMGPTVQYDIQFVGGIKNTLFGGEGLFVATLTGPGPIWLQSLPFSRLASRIFAAAPQGGGKRSEEGSVLGGLGSMIMGKD